MDGLNYPVNTRVVSINFAYGYTESSKLCAGTIVPTPASAREDGFVEVAWDDGDQTSEAVGDIVHIGVIAGDETFGKFAPCVTIVGREREYASELADVTTAIAKRLSSEGHELAAEAQRAAEYARQVKRDMSNDESENR